MIQSMSVDYLDRRNWRVRLISSEGSILDRVVTIPDAVVALEDSGVYGHSDYLVFDAARQLIEEALVAWDDPRTEDVVWADLAEPFTNGGRRGWSPRGPHP